ncbi:MAG: thioredoxin family protein [Desulfobulbaceae bacterium]
MDAATSRTIRIGSSTIGLIGLDIALNQAAAAGMPEEEAVEFLFAAVSRDNYIPAGAADKYRVALRQAYREHLRPGEERSGPPVIRIFGTGCVSCNNLQKLVIEALDGMGIAADIEQIHDPDEIGRQGIIMTPALMINGRVKSGGRMPTRAQIEQWLRELAPA